MAAAGASRDAARWIARPRRSPVAIPGLLILGAALGWELIGRTGLFVPDLFPSWAAIGRAFWLHVSTPVLLPHLAASLYEVGGGVVIGAVLGIPVGLAVGSRPALIAVAEPLILYLAVIPKIIVLPVFILFLGIGVHSKLAVGALAAFFPISLLTMAGMREVKPVYLAVARGVGATRWKITTRVYLPAVTAYIVGGLRIGLGAAVTGALLAETKLAQAGLGFLAISYYGQFRIAEMYSLFLVIFLIAAAINGALSCLLGRLTPHRRVSAEPGLFF
ncbi:MAG TPA: ABC transporter permease subunit [Methylomirabilota bacterium]|nr:ABC transporter permease subunit [Methylomirabilota bacterium]